MQSLPNLRIENPKRSKTRRTGSSSLFDYYAGYSPLFATSLIESAGLSEGDLIVDPWNGSGTTTESGSLLGLRTRGFDLNPAMIIVAMAKMINRRQKASLVPLAAEIANGVLSSASIEIDGDDPLFAWFDQPTVLSIRRLEAGIQRALVDEKKYALLITRDLGDLSDLAAFFYNGLFRCVRKMLTPFIGSNPTWIKKSRSDQSRLSIGLPEILRIFKDEIGAMASAIDKDLFCLLHAQDTSLQVASSTDLPLEEKSVQLIVSSPPYCTRIDYAVATRPELAILGLSEKDFDLLRRKLIGTATVSPLGDSDIPDNWGPACGGFLRTVSSHASKASATYYFRNHFQYFRSMFSSIGEIARVLDNGGKCVLVVQDSFYKDLHNDLPKILSEMAGEQGLSLFKRTDFAHRQNMAGINPSARKYRTDFKATESVLCFVNNS